MGRLNRLHISNLYVHGPRCHKQLISGTRESLTELRDLIDRVIQSSEPQENYLLEAIGFFQLPNAEELVLKVQRCEFEEELRDLAVLPVKNVDVPITQPLQDVPMPGSLGA